MKTTEHYGRVREYRKRDKLTYLDGQKCLCVAWRDLRCGKVDQQMSVNIKRGYGTQINQKMQKRKAPEDQVLLQKLRLKRQ